MARFYAKRGDRTLPVGFGCGYIGAAGDAAQQRRYQETLEQAYAAGIRYFDAAELYGGAEFRLGRFLSGVDRSGLFVATKSRIPPDLTPAEAAMHVRQSLRNSLERLQTDRIDLFQIHDVRHLDQVLPEGGVLEMLEAARAEGLIRYIGLATRWHDLSELAASTPGFDTVLTYLDYNLVDQSAAPMIAFAQAQGVGVINATVLANGLLLGSDPRLDPSQDPETRGRRPRAIRVYDFCVAQGVPVLAMALQFPLRNPGISIMLFGPGNPEQLQANSAALDEEIPESVWQALHTQLGIVVGNRVAP